ncbi:polyprenyl synthetase family protein [Corynebacterium mendelii]|uniref:Polyprenyl synthetase family protein n=1 Tax=Corynebacterium mendelii TaxID=2765362 RepID=A0A939IWJ3_9CORY|nr:polyprenyl synthetase family protein [Corynebacterium mendelii]MBN9643088.1 polyprenyl synthetase family protein [Corynebacterium mendelii]
MTSHPLDPATVKAMVDEHLAGFFRSTRAELDPIDPFIAELNAEIEDFVLGGGKRVRPLFAWAGYVGAVTSPGADPAGAEEDPSAVIEAVSALELIQACALIHDDIIDFSDTRRGYPTMHRRIESAHRARGWSGDGERFGTSVAILAGDLALAWADDILARSSISPAALSRAWTAWAPMRSEVIAGQILDISIEAARDERPESARRTILLKTAAYTIERPLHFGAAIGGADDRLIAAYRRFGQLVGTAFQLRDDLLGVFGDPQVTGKPAGDDLREGKRTELLAHALVHLDATDPAAAARLRRGIGSATSDDEIAELSGIIAATPAVAETEQAIAELTRSGIEVLSAAELSPAVTGVLVDLAHAATDRRH